MSKTDNCFCHCHTDLPESCNSRCVVGCEHCARQKNARWWQKDWDLVKAQASPFTLLRQYKDADFEWIEDFIAKVETQARQQALKDALEAIGTDEHSQEINMDTGEKRNVSDDKELPHIKEINKERTRIRANIEKLKHKA